MVDPLAGAGRILCQTIDLGEGGLDKANDFLSVRLQSAKEHQLHEGHFDLKRSVNLPSAALRQDEPFLINLFLTFRTQPRCGGSRKRIPMLQIMLACTRTGQFVPTGIETDIDTFIALPEALSLTWCPACGSNHYWTKSQAWICSTGCSTGALLPADIVCRY
jgi:hypothetical protein